MVRDPSSCPISSPSIFTWNISECFYWCIFGAQWDSSIRLFSGHCSKKLNHHFTSSFACHVRGRWWCNFSTDVLRLISLRRKILPDGTTLHAKESLPIRESSSRFLHLRCQYSRFNSANKASLGSDVMLASIVMVTSNCSPRKVMEVDGPSFWMIL